MPAKLTSDLGAICDDAARKSERATDQTLSAVQAGARRRARVDTTEMRAGLQARKTGRFDGAVEGRDFKTIFHEYGTHKMSAQPMLVPAAEAERERFLLALKKAWS